MINLPQNETFEHFALKEIGKLYLKHNQLCNFVAEEMETRTLNITEYAQNQFDIEINWDIRHKRRTDCLGIKGSYRGDKLIKSVEAKASYEDFKNGFCVGGEYNYIIAPKGVIPVDELPTFMGLIEIDFENFKYYRNNLQSGYNSKKRARRIKLDKDFKETYVRKLQWAMLYKLSKIHWENNWLEGTDLIEEYGDKFEQGVMWKN